MTACTACGTENRDKARFCRGCARPLLPLVAQGGAVAGAEAEAGHAAATPARSPLPPSRPEAAPAGAGDGQATLDASASGAPAPVPAPVLTPAPAPARRFAAAGLVGVVLVMGAAWMVVSGRSAPDADTVSASRPADAALMPVAAAVPTALLAATPSPLGGGTRPAATADASTAAATTTLSTTTATEKRAAPQPALATTERPADTARARAEAARNKARAPVAVAASPAASPAPEPAPAVAVAEAAPAAPAPRAPTVDQACADRSNFLTRDLCRIQACKNPAQASDPVCVRFREMEEASRNRVAQ